MDPSERGVSRLVVRTSIEAVRRALAWTPGWFGLEIALYALQALIPALQVTCVAWMTRSLAAHAPRAVWLSLWATAAVVAGGYLLGGLTNDVGQTQRSTIQNRLNQELRERIATLRPSQLADADVANKIQAAAAAVDYTVNGQAIFVIGVASSVLAALALLLSLWHISSLTAILVVLALAPIMVTATADARFNKTLHTQMSRNLRFEKYYTDQLTYQRPATELAALGTARKMAALADDYGRRNNALVRRAGIRYVRIEVITAFANVVLVGAALAALAMQSGRYDAGAAGVVGVISGISVTRGAGFAMGRIISAAPLIEMYNEVLNMPDPMGPSVPVQEADVLCTEGVTVRYPGADRDALVAASIVARRGEMVAIVGTNGAGKTTLVNAILGLVPIADGTIVVDGRDLAALPETLRLGYFGLLTQEFGRYELTVRQALLLGTTTMEVSDEHLWDALVRAHADVFVRQLPDGLDSQLGQQWGGAGISGGQWQRLALARIYLRDAAIWVLDEPTSAIDAESEMSIFSTLQADKHERITVVVSHRAATLRHMDRIYVVDAGRIVEEGTYRQLLSAGGRFSQIFAGENDPLGPGKAT